jgi:hypothetical protein
MGVFEDTPMNKIKIITAVLLSTAISSMAAAAIAIAGSVGGAPTGVSKVNFDDLPLGSAGGVATGPSGSVLVSFGGEGAAVVGFIPNFYARPFLSGGNGLGFGPGATNQADGLDLQPYLSTGLGSVTLTFGAPQLYLGMLWGSVDAVNKLEFYNGALLVGTVTGADVLASPNGDQGVLGTLYVNFVSTIAFNRVVATSTERSFEFDNVAFNPTVPGCSGCVYSQGYYKTHAAWPASSLKLGTTTYTQAQLQSILKTPVKGNGLISLAYQLIAAKLNAAKGACVPTEVANAIAAADFLIGASVIPPVGNGSASPSLTSVLTDILDEYNNGLAAGGPGHCN